jgi:hypothetical protein
MPVKDTPPSLAHISFEARYSSIQSKSDKHKGWWSLSYMRENPALIRKITLRTMRLSLAHLSGTRLLLLLSLSAARRASAHRDVRAHPPPLVVPRFSRLAPLTLLIMVCCSQLVR